MSFIDLRSPNVVHAPQRSRRFICANIVSKPGNILILFPEGTRSRTGRMREFKSGVGAIVAGRDVSVVPCYIEGAHAAWPKGQRLPRPRKIRVLLGASRNYRSVS